MEFRIRAGQSVVLYCGSVESEAVKTAVSNLEQDLKKVFPGVEVFLREGDAKMQAGGGNETKVQADGRSEVRTAQNGQAAENQKQVSAIVIRTLTGRESGSVGVDGKRMLDENGVLRKEAYQLRVQDGRLLYHGRGPERDRLRHLYLL